MHFATRVRTWHVARLSASLRSIYSGDNCSEIAQSQNPFGIGHMYVHIHTVCRVE
jgi:hypothetical protein